MDELQIIRNGFQESYRYVIFSHSAGNESFWEVSNDGHYLKVSVNFDGENVLFGGFHAHRLSLLAKGIIAKNLKNTIKKDDVKMVKVNLEKKNDLVKILPNGVKMYNLDVENDFKKAQNILNLNNNSAKYNAKQVFNERENADLFEGIYKVHVKPWDAFNRFNEMLENEKCKYKKYDEICKAENDWFADRITTSEFNAIKQSIYNCQCEKCTFSLTIEQWMTGIIEEKIWVENAHFTGEKIKKERVTKKFQKIGFSQTLLDFYSAQIKAEKDVYIFVSGKVQHIAGMSYYAKRNTWDGYMGTSCQDPRLGGSYVKHLGGALHDDKLIMVGLLENMEDIHNLEDNLKARVLMREVTIDGVLHLIPTRLYGNQQSKAMLDGALKELSDLCIHDMSVRDTIEQGDHVEWHREETNGYLIYTDYKRFNVEIERGDYVQCDCPICHGTGTANVELYDDEMDEYMEEEIECPSCDGDGTTEEYISRYVDTYIEKEIEMEIAPYYEMESYEHNGDEIEISVNYTEINRRLVKAGLRLV